MPVAQPTLANATFGIPAANRLSSIEAAATLINGRCLILSLHITAISLFVMPAITQRASGLLGYGHDPNALIFKQLSVPLLFPPYRSLKFSLELCATIPKCNLSYLTFLLCFEESPARYDLFVTLFVPCKNPECKHSEQRRTLRLIHSFFGRATIELGSKKNR
jgi:hypothetical protein